jgi:two-component system OmpR family sensor kinase
MLTQIEGAFAARAASERRMRQFIADASHELRTPLAAIRGYGELYRIGALASPEELAGAMRRIEDEAARMGYLVGDLLQLTRLDEGRAMRRELVNLCVLAADAAADLKALDRDRIIRIIPLTSPDDATANPPHSGGALPPARSGDPTQPTPTGQPGEPTTQPTPTGRPAQPTRPAPTGRPTQPTRPTQLTRPAQPTQPAPLGPVTPADQSPATASAANDVWVTGDSGRLRQVMTNLVGNVARHTPSASPVEIAIGTAGPTPERPWPVGVVEVRDHGPGIPADLTAKVFERFFRLDASRSRDSGGTGLGLAIVASVVAALGGRVSVRPTDPMGGATFRVELPSGPPPPPAPGPPPTSPREADPNGSPPR